MGYWQHLRLRQRFGQRVGARLRAEAEGRTPEQARADADRLYPPTPEDIAYEARLAREHDEPRGVLGWFRTVFYGAASVLTVLNFFTC